VLERYYRFFGDDLTLEYPTGSGKKVTVDVIVRDLQDRLISIFTVGPDGRRPCFGWVERLQQDPEWKDNLLFNEYFHGDNAAGLGASHQTGWTGVIADLIRRRHGTVPSLDDIIGDIGQRLPALRPAPRRPPPPRPRRPARPRVAASDRARRFARRHLHAQQPGLGLSARATVATGGHLDVGPRSVIVCRAPRS